MAPFLHSRRVALGAAVVLAFSPCRSAAAPLTADASTGAIVVHAAKAGLLSGMAHDHRLLAGRWNATVEWDPGGSGSVDALVVVDASSLHETTTRLGEASRARVDREVASPDVLDARRYPEIRIHATGVLAAAPRGEEEREGELRAEVTLHGVTRSIPVPFRVRSKGAGLQASGKVMLRQTDFGMVPFTTAMGTIGVDDELLIEFDLLLRPARPSGGEPDAVSTRPGGP